MPNTTTSELAVFGRRLGSIADLKDDERHVLEALPATIKEVAARNDIVQEGERPTHSCVLLDGWACRYKLRREGTRQVLALLVPGDAPDLQSLHLSVMDHSVAALTDARVAMIPHAAIEDLAMRHPRLGALLWRETLIDSAIFREWMVGMGRRSAYERIAHLWCELYVRQKVVGLATEEGCPFPIKLGDLADAMGLTTVHVSRTKGELKENGLASLRSRSLAIHDWDGLRAAAEFDPTYLHLRHEVTGPVGTRARAKRRFSENAMRA